MWVSCLAALASCLGAALCAAGTFATGAPDTGVMKSCSWPVFGASERKASCLLSADHAISCSSWGALLSPAVIRFFVVGAERSAT